MKQSKKNTIYTIAEIAGTAASTVSLALRDSPKLSEKTKIKIKAIAEKLQYTPDAIARALVTNRTRTLGVLISSEIASSFFTKIFRGIHEIAYKQGYSVIFYSADLTRENELKAIQLLLSKRVDGLMLFPGQNNSEGLEYLLGTKTPFVLFSRHSLEEKLDKQLDYVINDYEKSAYGLASHLIKLGHRNIAYVGFPLDTTTNCEKLNGYKKALAANGISLRDELIFLTPAAEIDAYIPRIVSSILAMKERPTAVFVVDDEEAVKVIKFLRERGIRIPKDIAVAGYGNLEFTEFFDPPLTTIDQFGYELGMKTAELLLDKIAGNYKQEVQHQIVKTKLIIRKSCGSYLGLGIGTGAQQ